MNYKIFKAVVGTPMGRFVVAVASILDYAGLDIRSASMGLVNCASAQIQVGEVTTSNRRIIPDMEPVKGCVYQCEPWAWYKRVDPKNKKGVRP